MSQNSPSLLDLIRMTLSSRKHLRFYILRMFVDKDEIILIKRRKRRQGEEEEASVHSATGTKDHRLGNILTHTHTNRRFFSQFWRLRYPSSRHQHGYALVKALFLADSCHFLAMSSHDEQGKETLWKPCDSRINPSHDKVLQKAPPTSTVHWALGLQENLEGMPTLQEANIEGWLCAGSVQTPTHIMLGLYHTTVMYW